MDKQDKQNEHLENLEIIESEHGEPGSAVLYKYPNKCNKPGNFVLLTNEVQDAIITAGHGYNSLYVNTAYEWSLTALQELLRHIKPYVYILIPYKKESEAGKRLFFEDIQNIIIAEHKSIMSDNILNTLNELEETDAIKVLETLDEVATKKNEEENDYYKKNQSVSTYLSVFEEKLQNQKFDKPIATGFKIFDKVTEGGLYPGLYGIGAISGLGKTTLVMQMADQIAQSKQDVLIFSLEMSREELIARSISRLSYLIAKDTKSPYTSAQAKTINDILNPKRYNSFSKKEQELINDSLKLYGSYTDFLYIYEGELNMTALNIRERVNEHFKITGRRPVVIVDYLQILEPADIKATDKQNIDKAIKTFKQISRDYSIPVLVVSSFNRDNYNNEVSHSSFNGSGCIEYTADALIGLQFSVVSDNEKAIAAERRKDIKKASGQNIRDIELHFLKNRRGCSNKKIHLEYNSLYFYFQEIQEGK